MLDEMHGEEEDAVARWMEERDRLVERTRAFVAGVAAAAAPLRVSVAAPEVVAVPAEPVEAPAASVLDVTFQPILAPAMLPRPKPVSAAESERQEINQRVAAFQAHQSRISREREAFYEATQSKIRDVLGNDIKPGQL